MRGKPWNAKTAMNNLLKVYMRITNRAQQKPKRHQGHQNEFRSTLGDKLLEKTYATFTQCIALDTQVEAPCKNNHLFTVDVLPHSYDLSITDLSSNWLLVVNKLIYEPGSRVISMAPLSALMDISSDSLSHLSVFACCCFVSAGELSRNCLHGVRAPYCKKQTNK